MTQTTPKLQDELLNLASLYCDERLDHAQRERLTSLLLQHEELVGLFVEYLQLHGQLVWDRALIADDACFAESAEFQFFADSNATSLPGRGPRKRRARSSGSAREWIFAAAAVVACGVLLTTVNLVRNSGQGNSPSATVVSTDTSVSGPGPSPSDTAAPDPVPDQPQPDLLPETQESPDPDMLMADTLPAVPDKIPAGSESSPAPLETPAEIPESDAAPHLTDREMIARINEMLADSWQDRGVTAAPEAPQEVWVRRAYLTLAGRVPTIDETQRFLASASGRSRILLVDQLLSDHRTSDNLAGIWLNLLIGRTNPRAVDDRALLAFLVEQFRQNRPWIETVGKLVAAECRSDQNGATNFLLAHLNDQATPATAVAASLFLGEQVHCTQCHNHPFAKDRTQDELWSLNAFFKQTERKRVATPDSTTTADKALWELTEKVGADPREMTFYETRRGVPTAVLPKFAGLTPELDRGVSRRAQLVRLLTDDPEHRVARSMVNRMWAHFFGVAFTPQVDDMGPHSAPCLPELLDLLTDGFVRSGYDLRRLMTWIALSDAWQLSSLPDAGNSQASPESEETALFSHVCSRQMGPEEVYESIRVALASVAGQPLAASIDEHRRKWVNEFVQSWGTDENDERLQFSGDVSQALLMMNGTDLNQAITEAVQALLSASDRPQRSSAPEYCLHRITMSILSREPTSAEVRVFNARLRSLNELPADQALATALEDMTWAYLNSAAFISVE